MNCPVLFIIYSCKKKLHLSEQLYDMINEKLYNCKVYLMYGDETINNEYKIVDEKYLVLKVGDYYENLTDKTIKLFNVIEKNFPNVKGCFKCDDDIIPSIISINKFIEYFLKNNIPYAGQICAIHEEGQFFWSHKGKTNNPDYGNEAIFIPGCSYAAGPMYYLNRDSISKLNNSENRILFSEDAYVGFNLNRYDIFPEYYDLYSDFFGYCYLNSYQNVENKRKKLYIKIHGGLGNQLFQIASGYGIAKKHNRILIIVSDNQPYSFNHNSYMNVYMDNIFKDKNLIFINENNLDNSIKVYSDSDIVGSFVYNDKIIKQLTENGVEKDIYLKGYFQNEKYFKKYKGEIIQLFKNERIMYELTKKYIHLNSSFFIHYRRGDYLNNDLYKVNFDKYFWHAYLYIYEKIFSRTIQPHFYILSDDIEYCKTYDIFNSYGMRRTFIENESTLNSFYIMSLCALGGICSNSTFSWWGSYLNENPNKIVIFPDKWINNGRHGKENDVYYENTILCPDT
jgi:hypothetical protein